MRPVVLAFAFLLALACAAHAGQTFYVTDEFEITLRAGPGLDYKILTMLTTGTPLEKLEESEGWARVRTRDGQEGWVVARYLTGDLPKAPQLEAARKELAEVRAENDRLRGENSALRRRAEQAEGKARQLAARLQKVEKEFARWKEEHADAVTLKNRLDAVEQERSAAQEELARLRTENAALQQRERFYWFFSGAMVLLAGWILGYLYASSRHRAKGRAPPPTGIPAPESPRSGRR